MRILLVALITLCLPQIILARTAPISSQAKGLEIAKTIDESNAGYIGESSIIQMKLIDAHGTEILREMEGHSLEMSEDGDKSLSVFLNPKDVKGTKLLTWGHKNDDDDQWLYLPSLRRVKRINSRSKSGSFMGSEFTYEDFGGHELEKYTYNYLRDEKTPLGDAWVFERIPVSKSGYSKHIVWNLKKYKAPFKVEYYDRKGELLKVAQFSGHKEYTVDKKSIWRSSQIHMKNVQTKKESILSWRDRSLGVKHAPQKFTKGNLK